ncbi:MAG TPA: hypothetical protein VM577_03515 [Anaerovoracaceae bacterium]|nr:hypothetical protein [Anaerovoracaceae bacterium]
MAFEDVRRNAKRTIELDIKDYLKGRRDESSYNYVFSKIDLAAQVSLITVDETNEYIAQMGNTI